MGSGIGGAVVSAVYQDTVGSMKPSKPDKRTRWTEDMIFPPHWIVDGHAARKRAKLYRGHLEPEAERFVNHAMATGCKYVSWHRAWLNWVTASYCKPAEEPEPSSDNVYAQRKDALVRAYCERWRNGIRGFIDIDKLEEGVKRGYLLPMEARW